MVDFKILKIVKLSASNWNNSKRKVKQIGEYLECI